MTNKLGPTGKFPKGRAAPDDKGELNIQVSNDEHGNVRIDFGEYVNWVAMPPEMAIKMAHAILKYTVEK